MEDSLKSNISLLITDDDAATVEALTFQLARQGYIVHSSLDAEQALEILSKKEIDLIITDVAMPKMNGLELLDEIKRLHPDLPVILLTGYGSVEMAVEAMKRGATDFISKPAGFAEISIRIEKALENVERKRAYLLLKEQVEELKKACEGLGKTHDYDFQSEKLAAMGLIVSGIAHEINNPLTAVIGYSQLLMDTGGQDMGRQLKVVRDQAQRCAKIIQELMFFARRRKPVFASIDLREVIEASVRENLIDFKTRSIAVSFSPPSGEMIVPGDAGLLQKVFSHILLNAAHALDGMKEKRNVEISFKDDGKYVQVDIRDNGPGISPEHLSRIFDPFFSTKEVGRGTGLGLSLCYGLVADHGGRILAGNEKGGGARFTVFLPREKAL